MPRKTAASSSESDFDDAPPRNHGRGKAQLASSDSDRSSTPSPKNGKLAARQRKPPRPVLSSDSESEDQPRPPLRHVAMNGHGGSLESSPARAKKRLSARPSDLRRQSLQNNLHRPPTPTGSTSNVVRPVATTLGKGPPPKVGALATTAARRFQARLSSGMLGAALGGEGVAPVSREVMANNYDEWMKMATDNKINTTNTWTFALIDYFEDMSLLRNTDGDGSINFQKASSTLDGCVKIYSSRVDSCFVETGKLLSGLAEDMAAVRNQGEEGEDGEDASDEEGQQRQKRQRTAKKADTLVDFEKLMVKKFDLEVSVDPLFKKTAADFDEGGAGGILMNHLGCDSNMRIIFDASDARLDHGTPADEEEIQAEDDLVDLAQLRNSLLPDLDEIDEMVICPSMSSFKFSADPNVLDLDLFKNALNSSTSGANHLNGDGGAINGNGESHDFFNTGEQEFMQEYGGGSDGYENMNGFDGDDGEGGANFFAEEPETLDPRQVPGEHNVVMAFAKDGDNQMFDYFDSALVKNWAGPQHWKMHRTLRRVAEEDAAATKAKRAPREKVEFSIDFASPSTFSSKELFEAGTRASTMLAKSKRKANEDFTLPEDIGFSSHQLLCFFLKPLAVLNVKKRGRLMPSNAAEAGELDERYWAEAAAAQSLGPDQSSGLDDDVGMPLPFATQFFDNEGDFGPDYDDDAMGDDVGALDAPTPGPEDLEAGPLDADSQLLAAMQTQARRVRPEHVNYAKKAKRVDVRKLKENIWRELAIEVAAFSPPVVVDQQSEVEDNATSAAEVEPKTFTHVLSGLRKVYPQERMDEISTSFCFICLLHLANEQGLRIGNAQSASVLAKAGRQQDEDDSSADETSEDADANLYVGDLAALRITREAVTVDV